MTQPRACGLVIFRRFHGTIQYLLMQTSYGAHHWTPPKGHVDPGESDMETAVRETEEEAGFVSSDLKLFEDAKHEMTYVVNGLPKIVIYWLAELLNPDKPVKMSNEHQAFEWLPLREACDLAKYPEMQKALSEFDRYISSRNVALQSFLKYWYNRYMLVTELYMVEEWERRFVHISFLVLFSLFFVFNYKVLLPITQYVFEN